MINISFLLGAGFSEPAGYKLGKDINEKLFNGIGGNCYRTNLSTWGWIETDKNAPPKHTTSEYYEPYLIDAFINLYQKDTGSQFDYEEFYDWFLDIKSGELENNLNENLQKAFDFIGQFNEGFERVNAENPLDKYSKVNSCYNYLIADFLFRSQEEEDHSQYEYLNKIIKKINKANFFTLNHDFLLENLFENWDYDYSDGFSSKDNKFMFNGKPVSFFQNHFEKDLRVFKLHGSFDYYRKPLSDTQKENEAYKIEDNIIKSREHREILHSKPSINKQEFSLDLTKDNLVPEFLTGKRKFSSTSFNTPDCFDKLFNHYKKEILNSEQLIIIGYSYNDNHINRVIKNAVDSKEEIEIINVNPCQNFRVYDKLHKLTTSWLKVLM
ncbi:MAG: SIR2 family protein, partial [Bacteroidia bacterium]